MSSETLLDLIRQKFSPQEGQMLVQSLSQDPQVWHFITNENKSLAYLQNIPVEISSFAPGAISLWLIEQRIGRSVRKYQGLRIQTTANNQGRKQLRLLRPF